MKLPSMIYVRIEEPENDEAYMLAYDNLDDAATDECIEVVGVYKLVEKKRVHKVTQVVSN